MNEVTHIEVSVQVGFCIVAWLMINGEAFCKNPHPTADHEDQTQIFFLLPCDTHLFSCHCQMKLCHVK